MEWYEMISVVVGIFGGTAGIVGLYKAKSEKTSIDIGNMKEMLDEAHKMYDSARKETDEAKNEYKSYKAETMKYISDFKERFSRLEKRLDNAETDVFNLKSAVIQGYRCKFPQKIEDCPVLKEYERGRCNDCYKNNE